MLIDVAKGVEAQTIKLFQVCSKEVSRSSPSLTNWIGKDKIRSSCLKKSSGLLGIRSVPIELADRYGPGNCAVCTTGMKNQVELFQGKDHSSIEVRKTSDYNDPIIREMAGDYLADQLAQDLELLDVAGDAFDTIKFVLVN